MLILLCRKMEQFWGKDGTLLSFCVFPWGWNQKPVPAVVCFYKGWQHLDGTWNETTWILT